VTCLECGETTLIEEPRFACAGCNGVELELITGRELSVTSIEVDEVEDGQEARE